MMSCLKNAAKCCHRETKSNETRNSPGIRRNQRHLRLRRDVQDALYIEGGPTRGNLFRVPSRLHRQAKARRYRGTRGSLQQTLRQETSRRRCDCEITQHGFAQRTLAITTEAGVIWSVAQGAWKLRVT